MITCNELAKNAIINNVFTSAPSFLAHAMDMTSPAGEVQILKSSH